MGLGWNMVALDDPIWSRLRHAYGPASDIPDLLRRLALATGPMVGYQSEPWFSLWSALYHQGDVFEASYAALPHIVDIACKVTGPIDPGFFQLPAAVEIARSKGRGPEVPSFLKEAYAAGLIRLSEAVARHCGEAWDQDMLVCVMSALAAAKGHAKVAEAIMNLDYEDIVRLIEV